MFNDHYLEINALVSRVKLGDNDAIIDLLDFYQPLTRAAIRRCINSDPRLNTYKDDLQAELYTIFSDLIEQYNSSRSFFSSYISSRLSFSLMQHSRRLLGKNTAGAGVQEVTFADMPEGWEPESNEDPFGRIETATAIQQALLLLKPAYQEAIQLSYFDQVTQIEASNQLGITQPAYCKRLKRALIELKKVLSDDFTN